MNLKKVLKNSDSFLTVIIVVGILIAVNFLAYQIFYRWDLTENKDYSISAVSKKTAANLNDVVNIKVFISKNLLSQYINLEQEVKDILDEYVSFSNNKVRLEFINPEELKNTEEEMYRLGIPALQFNVLEKDKYQIVRGYLGIVVQFGDKSEVIPVVEDTANLEYQVTLAIKKAVGEEAVTVGIVDGHRSGDLESEISLALNSLRELYQIRYLDLRTEDITPDIKSLAIIGPDEEFSEEEAKKIDAYLINGGSLLILADGVKIGDGLLAENNDIKLDKLLEAYGVKLNHNLVLDASADMASFSSGFITFSATYPFWPKITKPGFNQDLAAVSELESLTLPWVSSLDIINKDNKENGEIYVLVKTTNKAWLQTENYNLNPQQSFLPLGGKTSQYNLAIAIFEKFNSAYGQTGGSPGRLIVVGDSDFINDGFLRQAPENLTFFQNLVDTLNLDEDLIHVRSRGVSSRPIKDLSEGGKALTRYLNIFGVTILLIAFGMLRYYMRRRKSRLEEDNR